MMNEDDVNRNLEVAWRLGFSPLDADRQQLEVMIEARVGGVDVGIITASR